MRTRAQESSGADKSLKEVKIAEASEKSVDEPEGSRGELTSKLTENNDIKYL